MLVPPGSFAANARPASSAAHGLRDHRLRALEAELALHDLVDRLDDLGLDAPPREDAERLVVRRAARGRVDRNSRHRSASWTGCHFDASFDAFATFAKPGKPGGLTAGQAGHARRDAGRRVAARADTADTAEHADHRPCAAARPIDRERRVPQIAFAAERDRARHALPLQRMEHRRQARGVGRIRTLRGTAYGVHGAHQHV